MALAHFDYLQQKFFFVNADLKAFERRLTEVVSSYKPSTVRWRSKFECAQLYIR